MKPNQLEALPDVTPKFGMVEQVIEGRKVEAPCQQGFTGALFQKPEDGLFQDAAGKLWFTGWRDGEHVRREWTR